MKMHSRLSLVIIALIGVLLYGCEEVDNDIDPVKKFMGEWKCEENSTVYGPGYNYDVVISRNPSNSTEVLIANFYMQGINEKAVALATGNTLTIMNQKICDDTIEIEGSGSYINGEIILSYTANDGADLDNVSARYYRD